MPASNHAKSAESTAEKQPLAAQDPLSSLRGAVTRILGDEAPHPVIDLLRSKIIHIQDVTKLLSYFSSGSVCRIRKKCVRQMVAIDEVYSARNGRAMFSNCSVYV